MNMDQQEKPEKPEGLGGAMLKLTFSAISRRPSNQFS